MRGLDMNSIKSIAGTAHPVVLGMCLPVVHFLRRHIIKSGQLIYKNNSPCNGQDRVKKKNETKRYYHP